MKCILDKWGTTARAGLQDLREHPLKYTYSAMRDVCRDYWDVGASVMAGLAVNDYQGQTFGEARMPLIVAGVVGGIIGSGQSSPNRLLRNFFSGLVALTGSWEGQVGHSVVAASLGGVALFFNKQDRKEYPR